MFENTNKSEAELTIMALTKSKRDGNASQYWRNMSALSRDDALEVVDTLLDMVIKNTND